MKKDNVQAASKRNKPHVKTLCRKLDNILVSLELQKNRNPDHFVTVRSQVMLGAGFAGGFLAGMPALRTGKMLKSLLFIG